MYNLDFDENPSRAMSFVFKSKIVILYLTGSKHVNSQRASTPYAGFLAGYKQRVRRGANTVVAPNVIHRG